MLFNAALLAGLLLASEVPAVPSGLAARIARRRGGRLSQPFNFVQQNETANTLYSSNWAGAMWAEGNGTFNSVTATFTAPIPSGSAGSSASAWVGIDGYTCQSAILQTGIDFTVSSNGQATYNAWYEWFPDYANSFTGITISALDDIRVTVRATSSTSGTATVENLTNGETVSVNMNSSYPLCGQNAEWIVEDYVSNGQLVPFADFGAFTFASAWATGTGVYTPSGATIIEIMQNNKIVTNVSTPATSISIKYV